VLVLIRQIEKSWTAARNRVRERLQAIVHALLVYALKLLLHTREST
jgi:hypothetical protein